MGISCFLYLITYYDSVVRESRATSWRSNKNSHHRGELELNQFLDDIDKNPAKEASILLPKRRLEAHKISHGVSDGEMGIKDDLTDGDLGIKHELTDGDLGRRYDRQDFALIGQLASKTRKIDNNSCDIEIQEIKEKFLLISKVSGDLRCVLRVTNIAMETLMEYHQTQTHRYKQLQTVFTNNDKIHIRINLEAHLDQLAKYSNIFTFALHWQQFFKHNWNETKLPVEKYYWRPRPEISGCLKNSSQHECKDNMNADSLLKSTPNLPNSEHGKSLGNWTTKESLEFPLYFHVIHNCYVDAIGRIYSGNAHIIPFQCMPNGNNDPLTNEGAMNLTDDQIHREVFVMSQYWGKGIFHSTAEVLPRIAVYLDFLIAHPNILIQVNRISDHYEILGIERNRLIREAFKADIAYVPPGGGCGWFYPITGQVLSNKYQAYIKSKLKPSKTQQRNVVILIKRAKQRRYLVQHDEIETYLRNVVPRYNLTFALYDANNLPTFNATMEMFYNARLVVAPHGAGLTNLMFSQAGTRVLEVLQSHRTNYCFKVLVQILGHVYVGVLSLGKTASHLKIDLPYFTTVIDKLLENIRK